MRLLPWHVNISPLWSISGAIRRCEKFRQSEGPKMEQGLQYTRTRSAAIRALWHAFDQLEKADDAELDAWIRTHLPDRLRAETTSDPERDGQNDAE